MSAPLLRLRYRTGDDWLDRVLSQFDEFLQDHASCEKKASGMALSIASHYPDKPDLLNAMADLAVEELSHYREVIRLLTRRQVQPAADAKDAYVNGMNRHIRKHQWYLLDRLLVAAVVERRGHERFELIAGALESGVEQRFFASIAQSEKRHFELFLDLAVAAYPDVDIQVRLDELSVREAELLQNQPISAALH